MSEGVKELLHGRFTPLSKMNKATMKEECQMWRNIWGWIPSVVKYYISRTGTTVGVTIRNYKRFVGPLLETEWTLKGIEVGVYEKVYEQTEAKYYYEKKIVKLPIGQVVAFDWIAERKSEEEILDEIEKEEEQSEPQID